MADDDVITIADLREDVADFVTSRNWHGYHNPKDLAISIAIEAGELLEEVQWQDTQSLTNAHIDRARRERIRLEIADVVIYCLSLCNAMGLDLSRAVLDKIALNGLKYPVPEQLALIEAREE